VGEPTDADFTRVRSPFEGELIRLRAVEETDLPWINREFWNPEVTQHLLMAWPEPVQGTREWLEGTRSAGTATFLIETKAGESVGVCSLEEISSRSRVATLGIWIARPHWELGYGTDAVRTLCRFGFREMNLHRIELGVFETNPRAQAVYEKVGFRQEGRLRRAHFVGGRHIDLLVMGLLAEEATEP
jgi:RimJ/RimL family protein N-acetyltransferase